MPSTLSVAQSFFDAAPSFSYTSIMSKIELVIHARERDLGGFSVRRMLPYATHRMVGPFIFFDHMGPATFPPGQGIDVRPHPHIHLATVTYLFEGQIHHRDSLGSDRTIEPGAINWMTAGHGIVHSERSPPEQRARGGRLNGIQLWVALPTESQDVAPSFTHCPSHTLPSFSLQGVELRLLVGEAFGRKSPAPVHSDLFYLEAIFPAGASLDLPVGERECGVYIVEGKLRVEDKVLGPCTMAVAGKTDLLKLEALEPSRVMLLGGKPVGARQIYWNFVSSSAENIAKAKLDWINGPGSARFPKIPGDDYDFIPLPEETVLSP